MKEKITVATFNDRSLAEALEKRLEKAGITEACVEDESAIQRARLFAPSPKAHIRLEVPKDDVDRVRKLFAEWEADGALRGAVRCPECGHSRVQYPQFTRNFLLPNLMSAIFWKLKVMPAEYFCEDCQFTWPAEEAAATPELDTLYWPKDSKKGPLGPK